MLQYYTVDVAQLLVHETCEQPECGYILLVVIRNGEYIW